MRRIAHALVTHPWVVLAIVALLTTGFAYFARNARIDSSVGTLIDPESPDAKYYDEARRLFGQDELDIVLVVADDVFTTPTLGKIADLTRQIGAIPGVARVRSLATEHHLRVTGEGDIDTSPLMATVPADAAALADLRRAVMANPLLVGNLVAAAGDAATVLIAYEPMSDEAFVASGIHDRIEALVTAAQGPEKTYFVGIPALKVRSAELMRSDILTFGPACFVVVSVVLLLAFRTLRGMLLPAVTTGIGLVWTFGLMGYFDVPIDIGTITLPTLLIAVGSAYATHVVARYYEEVEVGGDAATIGARIVGHLGLPVLVTALTTVLGFASLVVYRISAIRHLGIFAVFGITALFVLALTFTVAALTLLRVRHGSAATARETAIVGNALDAIVRFAIGHRLGVLVAAGALIAFFGWGMRYVAIETSYLSYFPPGSPILESADAVSAYMHTGQATFLVVVDGPEENAMARLDTLQRLAALQDFIARVPGVDRTTSLVDYVKLLNRVFHDDDPAHFGLPATDAAVEQYLLVLDPTVVEGVVSSDFSRAAILVRSNLDSSAAMTDALVRIERFARDSFPDGFTIHPTGTVVLLNQTADALSKGQVQSVIVAMIVVFLVLSLQFLSLRFGLVAMVPNLVPIVIFFGMLGWTGVSLSLATSMIASIALGIGVDEAVHLLSEFNHHVRKHADERAAVIAAMQSVGPPLVYSTLALTLGFLVLVGSSFVPLRHFGWFSAMNVVASLFADLLLLPIVLVSTRFVTLWDVLGLKLGAAPQETIPLFHGLRPGQARVAALMGVLETVPAGQTIMRQGEPATNMYLVIQGRAEAVATVAGQRKVLGEITRGGVIGELGLLRQRPRTADVVALEDMEMLVVDERFLRVLRRRYPRIASTVLYNLTRIVGDRYEQVVLGSANA
jgi:hypothetical protein